MSPKILVFPLLLLFLAENKNVTSRNGFVNREGSCQIPLRPQPTLQLITTQRYDEEWSNAVSQWQHAVFMVLSYSEDSYAFACTHGYIAGSSQG